MTGARDDFEPHRRFLIGLAYRMLGSVADAEDIVQDAFLRWRDAASASRDPIREPRAYLARIVSRLCLDRMKSARARREQYVGTWLPEPIVDRAGAETDGDAAAHDISIALLMTLERLSPLERAAFLMHDVFDLDYAEVAAVLERDEAACRQLAARGREHVRADRPRSTSRPAASEQAHSRLAAAFTAAMLTGDVDGLTRLLADDVTVYSDGGGKRLAALNPIFGRDKVMRFFLGVAGKRGLPAGDQIEPARINGLPGFVLRGDDGPERFAIESDGEHIVGIYIVRNPDKLRHLS